MILVQAAYRCCAMGVRAGGGSAGHSKHDLKDGVQELELGQRGKIPKHTHAEEGRLAVRLWGRGLWGAEGMPCAKGGGGGGSGLRYQESKVVG